MGQLPSNLHQIKDIFDAVGPFMNNKIKSQQNIILKEEECIVTEPSDICEIFATLFSTNVNSIVLSGDR